MMIVASKITKPEGSAAILLPSMGPKCLKMTAQVKEAMDKASVCELLPKSPLRSCTSFLSSLNVNCRLIWVARINERGGEGLHATELVTWCQENQKKTQMGFTLNVTVIWLAMEKLDKKVPWGLTLDVAQIIIFPIKKVNTATKVEPPPEINPDVLNQDGQVPFQNKANDVSDKILKEGGQSFMARTHTFRYSKRVTDPNWPTAAAPLFYKKLMYSSCELATENLYQGQG
ncbi:hypothetical protein BDK51DRAFT_31528 [Blyttiomyces helicus]|uniref:Uncharacterized protein n=1 Tax=Blyttiomyces helicus TaxID=388810 RepID=A0A4P9WEN5_9FUNG|nr:hypothetical protein BDK51DRAFT_31528 [Blyttiomyces helicus]|eukprot:RKO90862.1 hypothetical protein BDK51DRAFT_31528 [Blyttiomyces helicus]